MQFQSATGPTRELSDQRTPSGLLEKSTGIRPERDGSCGGALEAGDAAERVALIPETQLTVCSTTGVTDLNGTLTITFGQELSGRSSGAYSRLVIDHGIALPYYRLRSKDPPGRPAVTGPGAGPGPCPTERACRRRADGLRASGVMPFRGYGVPACSATRVQVFMMMKVLVPSTLPVRRTALITC
ncbi:hypothetical protein GCM10009759_36740 [Kitasatospora saccharophila]|uniref:Uncharacterized protein n=1 Tax=Kitasatospora saccharophila TaxID=407973 RepID=A0ABN2X0K4_9ACTN